jgi:ubiquinone/menaquinone biosynthesis C-methylase UbiE
MTGMNFDPHAASYSARIERAVVGFGQRHDFYIRNKAEILLDLLRAEPSAKILDVGCGVGLVHPYLVDRCDIYGTDISTLSLKSARQDNPGVRYAAYDGANLPFGNSLFDCAFAINVMHHVPPANWSAFVAEMTRVVRPGGQVVVIEHNPFNLATQWVVRTCELDEGAVLVPPRRLRALFANSHLGEITTRYVLFTPFEGAIFRKLDDALRKVPLGAQYVVRGIVPGARTGSRHAEAA